VCSSDLHAEHEHFDADTRAEHEHEHFDADADADTHFDALHAQGSERTSRNQYNFQQLYCALEQHKWCDWLSVGRSHGLGFHQFRTRLSGFERRKCDKLSRYRIKCEHDLLLPGASVQWVCYKPQFQRQKCKDAALHA